MKCVIYGCGAIGKAVAGYSMRGVGAHVTFVDARPDVVGDLTRRGAYRIYEDACRFTEVSGVTARNAGSPEALASVREADCVVTCVGPRALPSVAREIARALGGEPRSRLILLYENDENCAKVAGEAFREMPEGLRIEKVSVERMSREYAHDGVYDALSEPYIPVILNQSATDALPVLKDPAYFMAVDDMGRYYARKLYTNNLGHAALGFFGLKAGYTLCWQAVADPGIRDATRRALEESAAMLVRLYGFSPEEMRDHLDDLLNRRYANTGLSDDLSRLTRDPARKLGPDERIIGPAKKCLSCGICPRAIARVASAALDELGGNREEALRHVCGLSPGEAMYVLLTAEEGATDQSGNEGR